MRVREATSDDAALLRDLLLAAYNWTGEQRVSAQQLDEDEHAARYLDGWMLPTDLGLVAVDDPPGADGSSGAARSLGAIWARALPSSAPGYGHVADDVPELSMAVVPDARGRGVGTALLEALLARAARSGWRALSLSVEDGNLPARALYERHGFRVVGRNGGSDTMLVALSTGRAGPSSDGRSSGAKAQAPG